MKLLVAIDGSAFSLRALEVALADRAAARDPGSIELHLINVQPPLSSRTASLAPRGSVEDFHREAGMEELGAAIAACAAAGVPATPHVSVGGVGESIAQFAEQVGAQRIVTGSQGRGAIGSMLLGSGALEIIRCARVPVLVVK